MLHEQNDKFNRDRNHKKEPKWNTGAEKYSVYNKKYKKASTTSLIQQKKEQVDSKISHLKLSKLRGKKE